MAVCYFRVSKAMCELPKGPHDSVLISQIKASDEEPVL